MVIATITSEVFVDDDTTTTDRLTAVLGVSSLEVIMSDIMQITDLQMQNRYVYSLTFRGRDTRRLYNQLKQLESVRILNGQPRFTMDNFADAATMEQGELLTLTIPMCNSDYPNSTEQADIYGIMSNISMDFSGNVNNNAVTCIFYVCDRLWVRNRTVVTSYTRQGVS